MKKYNAGLDKQVVELCNANASTAHGMTVGHGEDSENEGSDNEGSDGEGSDGEGSDGEEELSPPPSKKSKKSTSNQVRLLMIFPYNAELYASYINFSTHILLCLLI